MKKIIRQAGWLLLCLLTPLLFLGLQALTLYGALARIGLAAGGSAWDFLQPTAAGQAVWNTFQAWEDEVALAGQLACLAVGLPLWRLFFGKKASSLRVPGQGAAWGLLPAGLGLQFLSGFLVYLESLLWPRLVESYTQRMEQAGMGQPRWQIFLATLVLAPLVEELFCRGLLLGFARRLTRHFWLADGIQALCFGLLHMDWVQGSYAFFIGLLLGQVYKRYGRLSYCMLLHGVVNAGSFLTGPLEYFLPNTALTQLMLGTLGLLFLLWGEKSLKLFSFAKPETPVGPPALEREKKWIYRG